MIVLAISVIVLISLLLAPNRGLVWNWIRQQRNRRRLRRAAVLEALYTMAMHHGDAQHPHATAQVQAAVPGRGIRYTLDQLTDERLVARDNGSWRLTSEGVTAAVELRDGEQVRE